MKKLIKGYSNYYIYDTGEVVNELTHKILEGSVSENGYKYYRLSKDNKKIMYYAHRLVAEYFVPNPEHKPEVNHKDCNKTNNHYKNLEWVTGQENIGHAWKMGRCERTKAQRDAARENLKIARKKLKEIRDERRTLHEALQRSASFLTHLFVVLQVY